MAHLDPGRSETSAWLVVLLGLLLAVFWGGSAGPVNLAPQVTGTTYGIHPLPTMDPRPETNCTNGTGYTQLTARTTTLWAGNGNPSGYAPLNVSWTVYVSGGLPPYNITLDVNLSPGGGVIGRGPTGSYSFTQPGIFSVDLTVRDAAPDCQWLRQGAFGVEVWGSGGPHPVHINATALNGTVPLHDTFSVTVAGLSGPFTASWNDGNGGLGVGSTVNVTFWMPEQEDPVGACITNATGSLFACGVVYVNVTGTGILQLSVSPNDATSPYLAHAWMNLSHLDQIPGSARLTYDWEVNVGANSSVGSYPVWANLTASPASQSYWSNSTLSTPYDVPAYGAFVASILVGTRILALSYGLFTVEPANGSLPPPVPVLSYSVSPSSGSAPLNVTITATGNGGSSPYPHLGFGTVGAGAPDPNGSREPAWWANVTNWSGARATITHTFAVAGDYTVLGYLTDGAAGSSTVLASVTVTAAAAPRPLEVVPQLLGGVARDGTARFIANVSGGTAPYTVQWTFGDGTVGSSVNNVATTHQFPGPGVYRPQVSVRDGQGRWANSTLPIVTIPGIAASTLGGTGGSGIGWAGAGVLLGGGLCAVAPIAYQRHHARLRREGQRLVGDLVTPRSGDASRGPAGPPRS